MGALLTKLVTATTVVCLAVCTSAAVAGAALTHPAIVTHIVAPKLSPHLASPSHTYNVNTTTDDTLWSSAPAHTCEDTDNHSLCSLRAAIMVVADDFGTSDQWDVVNVPAGDFKLNSSLDADAMIIGESGYLTINGAGPSETTIDGSDHSWGNNFFDFDTSGIVASVNGVGFLDGDQTNGYGGAIFVDSGSSLNVYNCSFEGNETSGPGGAIEVSSDTNLDVTYSTFTENSAVYSGGAIDSTSGSDVSLSGDTFTDNISTGTTSGIEGGAVFASGDINADNSTFHDNTSYGSGGAVYATENGVFAHDVFSGNESYGGNGGALYANNNATLTNSTVTGNSAVGSGGGVYGYEEMYLNADSISSNTADLYGGDLYDDDNTTIDNSTFHNSTAGFSGGSIFVNSYYGVTMTNDTFTDTTADGSSTDMGGGAIYLDGDSNTSTADLTNVTINHGDAGGTESTGGGAIYADSVVGTFQNVTIENSVSAGADSASTGGGGLLCDGCVITLADSTVTRNSSAGYGGGVFIDGGGEVTTVGSTVSNNTGVYGGGYAITTDSNVLIQDSSINANIATDSGGGGIYATGVADLEVIDSTLASNSAQNESTGGGGAIELTDSGQVNLTNDTLADNIADWAGGVYVESGSLNIGYSTIVDNTARLALSDFGGGIYNSGTTELTGTIIANNTSPQCAGDDVASGGSNLDSDNSCGLNGPGDLVNEEANVAPLASNGGSTETVAPLATSAAIGHGGNACPDTDERGVGVPAGQPCDIGSVFVEKTTTTLAASAATVVKGKEQLERLTVVVTPAVKGSRPTGSATINDGSKLVCKVTLSPVPASKSIAYTGSCTLTPTQLAVGTNSLTATYLTTGAFASSTSAPKSVKVT